MLEYNNVKFYYKYSLGVVLTSPSFWSVISEANYVLRSLICLTLKLKNTNVLEKKRRKD